VKANEKEKEKQNDKSNDKEKPIEDLAVSDDDDELYTYKDVEDAIRYTYNLKKEMQDSTICDIIAVYIKGQKILYTEAKTYCETKLNMLMLPSIFISSAISILGPFLKDIPYGITITSGFSGLTAFILAIITYLKLDAKAEAHRAAAYKFDKLQSHVEFESGKVMFLPYDPKKIDDLILEVDEGVREIKETNPFVLPERVRYGFPKLYGTNIFSAIKLLHLKEVETICRLKDVFNSMLPIKKLMAMDTASLHDEERYEELMKEQRKLVETILQIRQEYHTIDQNFEAELRKYRKTWTKRLQMCDWCNV